MSDEGHLLWVGSDVSPLGVYGVSIHVGEDRSWSLTPDRAIAYAATCFRRATEAEHDVAVVNFLKSTGLSAETAYTVLTDDLWPDRVVDHSATEPMMFLSAVGRDRRTRSTVPALLVECDGRNLGTFPSRMLRSHAAHVLDVVAAVDLDSALLRCLTGTLGLEQNRARGVVAGLADHWPAEPAEGGAR